MPGTCTERICLGEAAVDISNVKRLGIITEA